MDLVLSVVMLTAAALVAGAIYLFRKGGYTKQAWLMIVLAAVMAANILIWTVPGRDSVALVDRAAAP